MLEHGGSRNKYWDGVRDLCQFQNEAYHSLGNDQLFSTFALVTVGFVASVGLGFGEMGLNLFYKKKVMSRSD